MDVRGGCQDGALEHLDVVERVVLKDGVLKRGRLVHREHDARRDVLGLGAVGGALALDV